jgi:phenylalanine-4-hydroxylase
VRVQLADDHPGANDPDYRARRDSIAARALGRKPGDPIPHIEYTEREHEVWRTISRELAVKHERLACEEFIEAAARLQMPTDHVPQLDEVGARLTKLTGFRFEPAAGVVDPEHFYGDLADGVFHSTQYLRHHSRPLYTPEPDAVHELIGHGNSLASERFAKLYRQAGGAARRMTSGETLDVVSRVFWFSLEFGVLREHGEVRAYGAGLLSSYGEIEEFRGAEIRPLDIGAMAVQAYDITHYQPVLFCAEGFDEVEDIVGGWFERADDEVVRATVGAAGATA